MSASTTLTVQQRPVLNHQPHHMILADAPAAKGVSVHRLQSPPPKPISVGLLGAPVNFQRPLEKVVEDINDLLCHSANHLGHLTLLIRCQVLA